MSFFSYLKKLPARGGVAINHNFKDGKNYYEVEAVLHTKNSQFLRKGDKLLKINGVALDALTPTQFAQLLAKPSPLLTIHQNHEDPSTGTSQEPGALHPYFKEDTDITFCLEMTNNLEDTHFEDCPETGVESDFDQDHLDNLLLVAMIDASVSVVTSRACDHGEQCTDCKSTKCSIDDMVLLSHNVTLGRNGHTFSCLLATNLTIVDCQYSNISLITIYYYQTDCVDGDFKGSPVVLNFSGTELFLKCSKRGDKAILSVEPCEKKKLKWITMDDSETLQFLFYMVANSGKEHHFESASCPGWFIHTADKQVGMGMPVDFSRDQAAVYMSHQLRQKSNRWVFRGF
uniref:Interleukin-1 n=1 Tax=Denticeps clupeoides TaxID=299321 RepID=A0AAY4C6I7_9TELE